MSSMSDIFQPVTHEPDHVGRILAQWNVSRPDLDVSPMGIIGRLQRLSGLLDDELRPVFAEAGLGEGEFDLLATLRRAEPPRELTPGQLASSAMVTSGAVTKRLDRLERRGLVRRTVSESDARSRRVTLTEEGFALVDEVLARHVANEHRLVSSLSDLERSRLAHLLETWGRHLGS